MKQQDNMRMMKLKEIWDPNKLELLTPTQQLSDLGTKMYWEAIDAAFKFNMSKRSEHLARAAAKSLRRTGDENSDTRKFSKMKDPAYAIFKRRRQEQDKFHWSKEPMREENRRNRFLLPHPKHRS